MSQPPRSRSTRSQTNRPWNDRPPHKRRPQAAPSARTAEQDPETLLFGIHAIAAALQNPDRKFVRLYLTENAERRLHQELSGRQLEIERVTPKALDQRLGSDTVHQGAAADVEPLAERTLDEVLGNLEATPAPLLILDQLTDPHNVGAILRSAAVFGAAGIVMTRRHSPPLGAALAKSASGALETVPVVLVQNLGDTLQTLRDAGVHIIGLDGTGEMGLVDTNLDLGAAAFVLGAEGKGLRQRTKELCDALCRIEPAGSFASLNVSNAAAVALHFAAMKRRAM
jgi:23S rRNA (guanosine2251-2'-O)-methyltransferase